jgi:beta-fructofuranosidase
MGAYAAGRFTATVWGRLSFGESYYAPSFFRDSEDRPCVIFWMRGVVDADARWAGCLSVPYLLSVNGERLVAQPHPTVTAARPDEPGRAAQGALTGVVDLEWEPAPDGDRLVLLSSGTPTTTIAVASGSVTLDRPGHAPWTMPHTGGPLRVLVDGPVLEVSTRDGLLGGAISPAEEIRPVRGRCSAWFLAERADPR